MKAKEKEFANDGSIKNVLTSGQIEGIHRVQAVLSGISNKSRFFFNYTLCVHKPKLVRPHGKDVNGFTNYVLTEKGKRTFVCNGLRGNHDKV